MTRRDLNLPDLDAVVAEARALHDNGYQQLGEWNLTQICRHCTFPLQGAVDGFDIKAPAHLRLMVKLLGIKKKMFRARQIKPGIPAPPVAIPEAVERDLNEEARALEDMIAAVDRLKVHAGALHPNPFFGPLTHSEWLEFNTIHITHHLRFLQPESAATAA